MTNDEATALGKRLRAVRAYAGIEVRELAKEVGVTRTTIWRWESGVLPKRRAGREAVAARYHAAVERLLAKGGQ